MSFFFSVFILFSILVSVRGVFAEPLVTDQARVELVAEVEQITAGAEFAVAVHFQLEKDWHIYWQNPGSSGLPLELTWDLPVGVEAGAIQWPAPYRFDLDGYLTYGYKDTVSFIVPIRVADDFTGEEIELRADAFWLTCKEICLPGEGELKANLSVGSTQIATSRTGLFTAARASLPLADAPWKLTASFDPVAETATLQLGAIERELPTELYFYANKEGVIDPNAVQTLSTVDQETAELALLLDSTFSNAPVDGLMGVIQTESGSWSVDVRFGEIEEAIPSVDMVESGGFEQLLLGWGLPGFLALAFLGGLILNVMPCVLPVLSLKVFSLLKHSGQSKKQALAHGLAYTAGVVLSFVALAGVLFALRSVGERVGWGFQLQDPNFVVLLVVVFFLFGLNLMGVFEIGTSLVGADAKVAQRSDIGGSFGMGVLAAVVGAPCMGPLLAGVSGVAVQASVLAGLLIFGVMGLGLASPFLLLSVFPKLVAYLPKPGVWMESLKQFMGFMLMAAVVFLALVVGRQGGVDAIFAILVVLLLTSMGAWIYGRWAAPVKSALSKRVAIATSALLVIGACYYGIESTNAAYASYTTGSGTEDGQWPAWSSERVQAELDEGNPVFIDFTATWCLICQVNKKVALRTDETTALFEEAGVVALQADWTRYDAAITDELERFGRSGVPLYVLYSPDGEVTVLPQSLTNGIVREAVEKIAK